MSCPSHYSCSVFFVGYPMQWLWFQKIVQGLMKVLRGKPTKGKKA